MRIVDIVRQHSRRQFHAQAHSLVCRVHVKDTNLHRLALMQQLLHGLALRERHLGNMDQPLNTLLQFGKRAIGKHARDSGRNGAARPPTQIQCPSTDSAEVA